MTIAIEQRPAGSGAICRSILADLGDWFGLPDSNAEYEQLAQTGPAVVALMDGEPVGLMLLKDHFGETLEIYFLAVRRERHRGGVGRALVEHAEILAAQRGARFLSVKTRGPSKPYEPYERTRRFYQAMGFAALEEFPQLWDPENPALFMAKAVRTAASR
ncbi:MAG TPA: GNAT family N-acetyltransferase [Caulobacteraceae bacterium]|nr:GNAT family N-acetyltransferase [Caulobacteraceae bacterium]